MNEIEKERQFMIDTKAKLKAHDKMIAKLTERIEKLEKQAHSGKG